MLLEDREFDDVVKRLRAADPHGRRSTADLERSATIDLIRRNIEKVRDPLVSDILESIVSLL